MEKGKQKTFIDRIWDFFSSVKLAIVVFALIGLTSIVGTILEQNAPPEKNLKILKGMFGDDLAPSAYSLFDALGFMDMYHSWWFMGLLMVFGANLLICSIDRFPGVWKLVKAKVGPLEDDGFKTLPIRKEFVVKGKPESKRQEAGAAFKSAGISFHETSAQGGGCQLYGQKGNYSRLGVFMTHLSILLIMLGAVVGIVFGFSGSVNLPEGANYSFAFSRSAYSLTEEGDREMSVILEALQAADGSVAGAASALRVSEGDLRGRMKVLGVEPLGFLVRCEDFKVDFYGTSDMPKEYSSLLTVIEGGKAVEQKWIEVNDPLRHKGYTFYQSSYGMVRNPLKGEFVLRVAAPGGQAEEKRLRAGEKFLLPGSDIEVVAAEFSPAVSFDQSGRPFTYSEMMNNPAVRLEITRGGEKQTKWVLKRYPETGRMQDGWNIQFVDLWGAQYTGLQVRKDPGVWIVYLGCALMSVGLYMTFFMSHRRLWIKLVPEKNTTKVLIGGSANKTRQSFEQKINKMASLLGEGGK